MPEDLLLRDGCRESINTFWATSGLNPSLDFYPGPEGNFRCWVCGWVSEKSNKPRVLKCHLIRKKHWWSTERARLTAKKDVYRDKLEDRQKTVEGQLGEVVSK